MPRKVATTKHKTTTTRRKTTTTKRKTASTKSITARKKTTTTRRKSASTRKYSPAVGKEVGAELRKFKKGTAKSGRAGTPVKSRKQAIAIALSEARKKGEKVPTPKKK
jgi:Family of unknown function (DUF6496)